MTTLREAAQQALEALEVATNCLDGYYIPRGKTTLPEIEDAITALKAALAEPDSPERRCGGPGCDMRCCQPVEEPVYLEVCCDAHPKWMRVNQRQFDEYVAHGWEGRRLYTTPPQRKPLAEWQINDLMADIDPEDRDSWSFRQGVYAAEKHHGVRK